MHTENSTADNEADAFMRGMRKQSQWWLCCYGEWLEYGDTRVIFDRCYRPICRIWPDGSHEIVPADEFIRYRSQRHYHSGFGMNPDPQTRDLVRRFIARYRLTDELRRRRDLMRQRELPRWNRGGLRHVA